MPTRQAAINEIMALFEEMIGDDELRWGNVEYSIGVEEGRNQLRQELRNKLK